MGMIDKQKFENGMSDGMASELVCSLLKNNITEFISNAL